MGDKNNKKDYTYFSGPFWVIADSIEDIYRGKYELLSEKFQTDYNGEVIQKVSSKNWVHEGIWENKYKKIFNVEFDYYPRGRVNINNGIVWVNIPRIINLPDIIDKVVEEYSLQKLVKYNQPEIAIKDCAKGKHYYYGLGREEKKDRDRLEEQCAKD